MLLIYKIYCRIVLKLTWYAPKRSKLQTPCVKKMAIRNSENCGIAQFCNSVNCVETQFCNSGFYIKNLTKTKLQRNAISKLRRNAIHRIAESRKSAILDFRYCKNKVLQNLAILKIWIFGFAKSQLFLLMYKKGL